MVKSRTKARTANLPGTVWQRSVKRLMDGDEDGARTGQGRSHVGYWRGRLVVSVTLDEDGAGVIWPRALGFADAWERKNKGGLIGFVNEAAGRGGPEARVLPPARALGRTIGAPDRLAHCQARCESLVRLGLVG